jgi:putative oxidoreductase
MSQVIARSALFAYGRSLSTDIPLAALAGRILLSAIFIIAGLMKFADWQGTAQYMEAKHVPLIPVLLPIAALVEICGGLALLLGLGSRWMALALFLFLTPTTLVFHNFWAYVGVEQQYQMQHFLKNLAIMGGLALIVGLGPGSASFDAWLAGLRDRRLRTSSQERGPLARTSG